MLGQKGRKQANSSNPFWIPTFLKYTAQGARRHRCKKYEVRAKRVGQTIHLPNRPLQEILFPVACFGKLRTHGDRDRNITIWPYERTRRQVGLIKLAWEVRIPRM